jgi:hypothetical protein
MKRGLTPGLDEDPNPITKQWAYDESEWKGAARPNT